MSFIFDHFLGTLVNFLGILVAGILGTLLKRGVPKRFSEIIMSAMAVCVIYIGVDGTLSDTPPVAEGSFLSAGLFKVLVMIVSMALGALIGELIDLDALLHKLAAALGRLFGRIGAGKHGNVSAAEGSGSEGGELSLEDAQPEKDVGARFAEGFVACSLLFCVGAMSVNGAILDAQGEPGTLLAKSVIDAISCFVMSSSLGIGCAFSAFAVLIYQSVFNVVGLVLAEVAMASTISYMSAVGSLIIILIGTNILGVTKVKTANMVPAMFVAIGVEALFKLIFAA